MELLNSGSNSEMTDGAFAFIERVFNDHVFREQLPDHADVAIVQRSGIAMLPPGSSDDTPKVFYSPQTGEVAILNAPKTATTLDIVEPALADNPR